MCTPPHPPRVSMKAGRATAASPGREAAAAATASQMAPAGRFAFSRWTKVGRGDCPSGTATSGEAGSASRGQAAVSARTVRS